jgi:hypothetical protein
MKPTRLPRPVQRPDGSWWIPRCLPHWTQACGPYSTRQDAESDRAGMDRLVNSPEWRSHIMDLTDEGIL